MRKIFGNGKLKVFIEELNFKNVLKSLFNMLYHFFSITFIKSTLFFIWTLALLFVFVCKFYILELAGWFLWQFLLFTFQI